MIDFLLHLFVPISILMGIIIIIRTFMARSSRLDEKTNKLYLDAEHEASFSRTRPIEQTRLIVPDISKFPLLEQTQAVTDKEKVALERQNSVIKKASLSMGHFDEPNIQLKKMYGAANIEVIASYEENYTAFMQAIVAWAKALIDANKKADAVIVLEEGIKLGLDLSQGFIILADLYKEDKQQKKLVSLYELSKTSTNPTMHKVITHIETLL